MAPDVVNNAACVMQVLLGRLDATDGTWQQLLELTVPGLNAGAYATAAAWTADGSSLVVSWHTTTVQLYQWPDISAGESRVVMLLR